MIDTTAAHTSTFWMTVRQQFLYSMKAADQTSRWPLLVYYPIYCVQ